MARTRKTKAEREAEAAANVQKLVIDAVREDVKHHLGQYIQNEFPNLIRVEWEDLLKRAGGDHTMLMQLIARRDTANGDILAVMESLKRSAVQQGNASAAKLYLDRIFGLPEFKQTSVSVHVGKAMTEDDENALVQGLIRSTRKKVPNEVKDDGIGDGDSGRTGGGIVEEGDGDGDGDDEAGGGQRDVHHHVLQRGKPYVSGADITLGDGDQGEDDGWQD